MTQEQRIEAICDELKALLIRKNRDYDDSFSKQYAKYGVLSGLIRLDDKMSRLDNLVNGGKDTVGESVEDTLLDAAGYAVLTLVEKRKESGVK
ncbi:nucleotide modification associated domain-containing protein [Gottfriedia sp. S16(2024)]|uniref:nucleotide modification associated domain-containing protein n=1 Tax=Gottfriedia sp. S16(2024) TaxID=3162883 RepID=UPI003D25A6F8